MTRRFLSLSSNLIKYVYSTLKMVVEIPVFTDSRWGAILSQFFRLAGGYLVWPVPGYPHKEQYFWKGGRVGWVIE